jgi:hypothetical protein
MQGCFPVSCVDNFRKSPVNVKGIIFRPLKSNAIDGDRSDEFRIGDFGIRIEEISDCGMRITDLKKAVVISRLWRGEISL